MPQKKGAVNNPNMISNKLSSCNSGFENLSDSPRKTRLNFECPKNLSYANTYSWTILTRENLNNPPELKDNCSFISTPLSLLNQASCLRFWANKPPSKRLYAYTYQSAPPPQRNLANIVWTKWCKPFCRNKCAIQKPRMPIMSIL